MSLLESWDYSTGKGVSRMFLAHHLDESQKPTLLQDHPGHTPCGAASQLRGAPAGWGCRPALLKQPGSGLTGLECLARIITGDCEMSCDIIV